MSFQELLDLGILVFSKLFQVEGPDGFQLGIGWFILFVGLVIAVIGFINKRSKQE